MIFLLFFVKLEKDIFINILTNKAVKAVDMRYHINTGLILEQFAKKEGCPLCSIQKIVEKNICKELLADGCMDDTVRTEVNQKGFCEKHFNMLYEMPSKLSLALQLHTRINSFSAGLVQAKNTFSAKKLAKQLKTHRNACFVCDYTHIEMVKYYKTVAELYANEKDFATLLADCGGFCTDHFAYLLEYANFAGSCGKQYVSALLNVQNQRMQLHLSQLKTFEDRHDYRNAGKPLGDAETVLLKIKEDLYGKK